MTILTSKQKDTLKHTVKCPLSLNFCNEDILLEYPAGLNQFCFQKCRNKFSI